MKMRVLFIVRTTFDKVVGGDSQQARLTARELRKLGVAVDIRKAAERIDYRQYDIMHLFNVIRPSDHMMHLEKSGLPAVLSTIYLDYSRFDRYGRGFPASWLFRSMPRNSAEYLKNCYRVFRRQDVLVSPSYLSGHRRAVKQVLNSSGLLLPNSLSEYRRLVADFGTERPYRVIPNGIDTSVFSIMPDVIRRKDQVLCVGQVYGLKNQHRLIEVTGRLGVKLVIIGKPPPNHGAYYDYCRKIAHRNVVFKGFLPQDELRFHYAESKVHALPSWFETTGLSSLEAGAMGCRLVVGEGGDTHEYFDGNASFCQAEDLHSIESALTTELGRENGTGFRDLILSRYTWEAAARETLLAYQHMLGHG